MFCIEYAKNLRALKVKKQGGFLQRTLRFGQLSPTIETSFEGLAVPIALSIEPGEVTFPIDLR